MSNQKEFDQKIMHSPLLRGDNDLNSSVQLPITVLNSRLLSAIDSSDLRSDLEIHHDYFLIPEYLWA